MAIHPSIVDKVSIENLENYPEFVPIIASWVFDYWGKMYRMNSMQEQVQKISGRLNSGRLPLAFVALLDSVPVGTASLKIQEMTTHTHLYHWLGTVYVAPPYRNQGIGSALVRHAELRAKALGIKTIYLHTPDKERFYHHLGWETIERPEYFDMQVVVMEKNLTTG